jgi:hypothetical protein
VNSMGNGRVLSFHNYQLYGRMTYLGWYDGDIIVNMDLKAVIASPYGDYTPRWPVIDMKVCVAEMVDWNCTQTIASNRKGSLQLIGHRRAVANDEPLVLMIGPRSEISDWVTLTGSIEVTQGDNNPSYVKMEGLYKAATWIFGLIPVFFVIVKIFEYGLTPPYPTSAGAKVKTQ